MTADRDFAQHGLMSGDRDDLEVTASERWHVLHQQIADNHTCLRPRSIRTLAREQGCLPLSCFGGTVVREHHITIGGNKRLFNESAARLPAGVSRCNHDRITLL
ncbi:MAG: hypothetical protein LC797_08800 [Chloroflexi bacterium]|nr:hypothetical protein [Chloroflexota bacterium]